jgi:protein-S-isoprenylcysteine O-methyltransferase Ste14
MLVTYHFSLITTSLHLTDDLALFYLILLLWIPFFWILLYMLMPLSMASLPGAPAIFLLAILNILLYQMVTPLEERRLLEQYGPQYEEYQRSIPRFVPEFGRKRQTRI